MSGLLMAQDAGADDAVAAYHGVSASSLGVRNRRPFDVHKKHPNKKPNISSTENKINDRRDQSIRQVATDTRA